MLQALSQTASKPKIALILLTYNAASYLPPLFKAILSQTLQPDLIFVIDSSSKDNTLELLKQYPVQVHSIPQKEFDHGGTRRLATQLVDSDIYIYITQDAIPADPDCFKNLIAFMTDEKNANVGCAFGRQLPHANANPLSIHIRAFNYPNQTSIKQLADKKTYGIKTCFNSNSFSSYRKTALFEAGNFPNKLPMCEDVYVAAKMLQKGFKVAYLANACVHHSHNLSLKEEFHRYFFIGVFHREQPWIREEFASPNKEGIRFIYSEISYLIKNRAIHWIPRALASTGVKYIAYQLGLLHRKLPRSIKTRWGITTGFWTEQQP